MFLKLLTTSILLASTLCNALTKELENTYKELNRAAKRGDLYAEAELGYFKWVYYNQSPYNHFYRCALKGRDEHAPADIIAKTLHESLSKGRRSPGISKSRFETILSYCNRASQKEKRIKTQFHWVCYNLKKSNRSIDIPDGWSKKHADFMSLLKNAAEKGHPQAQMMVAKELLYTNKNHNLAISYLEEAVKNKDYNAALLLADLYLEGQANTELECDLKKATKHYLLAARLCDDDYLMGQISENSAFKIMRRDKKCKYTSQIEDLLLNGLLAGRESSAHELIKLFHGEQKRSNNKSKAHAYMQYYLDSFIPKTMFKHPPEKISIKKLRKRYAIIKNNCKLLKLSTSSRIDSTKQLAYIYENDPSPLKYHLDLAESYKISSRWHQQRYESINEKSLEERREENLEKSKKLYKEVLKLLNRAQATPGITARKAKFYLLGECKTKQKANSAISHYRTAAMRKQPEAAYMLGDIYYYGYEDIKTNHSSARYWYDKGLKAGDPLCALAMARFYYNGEAGLKKNKNKALELFKKGAEMLQLLVAAEKTSIDNFPGLVFDLNSSFIPNDYQEAFAMLAAEFEWDESEDTAN